MNILNESLTGLAFSLCYIFHKDLDQEQKDFYGWLLIFCTCFILLANLVVAIVETVKNIVLIIKKILHSIN